MKPIKTKMVHKTECGVQDGVEILCVCETGGGGKLEDILACR